MELDKIDFSINDTVDQVKQMLQHRAQEKDIELLVRVDPEVEDVVIGDPIFPKVILFKHMMEEVGLLQRFMM